MGSHHAEGKYLMTHRSTVMPAARAAAINESNWRPRRPPWLVLPHRPRVVLAGSGQRTNELQELYAQPLAHMNNNNNNNTTTNNNNSKNGNPPFFQRDVRITLPEGSVVSALAALPAARGVLIGLVDGVVGLCTCINNNSNYSYGPFTKILCIPTSPLIVTLAAVHRNVFVADDSGAVTKVNLKNNRNNNSNGNNNYSSNSSNNRNNNNSNTYVTETLTAGKGVRNIAMCAMATTNPPSDNGWKVALSNARGCVSTIVPMEPPAGVSGVPRFGNARALLWSDYHGLIIGGEDDSIHIVREKDDNINTNISKDSTAILIIDDDDNEVGNKKGEVADTKNSISINNKKRGRPTYNNNDNKYRVTRTMHDKEGHCSFVTALAERRGRIMSAGLDGRVVLWDEDGLGQVILERQGEAFYGLNWIEERVIYITACVDEKGKCMIYRVKLADPFHHHNHNNNNNSSCATTAR